MTFVQTIDRRVNPVVSLNSVGGTTVVSPLSVTIEDATIAATVSDPSIAATVAAATIVASVSDPIINATII